MVVTELHRSITFYEELLGSRVTVSDDTVALLVGPEGSSCTCVPWVQARSIRSVSSGSSTSAGPPLMR